MNKPPALKSAINALIAIGAFYALIILIVGGAGLNNTDTFGKIFGACLLGLALLLWTAAFLLHRQSNAGKYIWWACCPIVMVQFPIGTLAGAYVFSCLSKPEVKAVLAGRPLPEPPIIQS